MKKLKLILMGEDAAPVTASGTAALSPQVQTTLKAGLALLFDGLNDIPGGVTPEILGDLQLQLASYHPGNPTSFQQWLTDSNELVQTVVQDIDSSGASTSSKNAANWIGTITQFLAAGKNIGSAIFLSLFKKHSTPAPQATKA